MEIFLPSIPDAQTTDLHPIKYLWNKLHQKSYLHIQKKVQNLESIKNALQERWKRIVSKSMQTMQVCII